MDTDGFLDLRGTEAKNCKITKVLADEFLDAINTLEKLPTQQTNTTKNPSRRDPKRKHEKKVTMINNILSTPAAQIALYNENSAFTDDIEPRNLVEDLQQANIQRDANLLTMSTEKRRTAKFVTL